jgi:hypothetical protein
LSSQAKVTLMCKKTVLAKQTDIELKFPAAFKKTTTTYPTFKVDVNFPERNSPDGKQKKSYTCPFCKKKFGYKAFRREFSLRKAAKWAGLLTVISVLLFLVGMALFVFGGWDIDPVMWYFGLWGIVGFFLGVGLLFGQTLRYLAFYRHNKYRYFFLISELLSQHVTTDDQKRVMWEKLPVQT